MHETLQLVLTQARMVWRFRWAALLTSVMLCATGWTWVILTPNRYEVTTKVFLDTRSMLRPLLRGLTVDTNIREDTAQMVRRTLLVRPNLESVARKTDLDLEAKTPEQFERLLNGLAEQVKIQGTPQDNIFVISYGNTDPELGARVVQALLNIFVERSLGESRKDTTKTRQFIEKQIAEYERRLDAAEERVKEFKQRNMGVLPGSGDSYFARLEEMRGRIAEAELALNEATKRRDAIAAETSGEEPVFGLVPPPPPMRETERASAPVTTPLDPRIESLKSNLDGLLLQYTEKHPDVVSTRRLIEDLEAQREKWIEDNPPPPAPEAPSSLAMGFSGDLGGSVVMQELKVKLSEAEGEVAAMQARVDEYKRRADELEKLVDTVPRVEAELARLNRDYEVNRRNYEELVKRRESLKLSDDAVQTTDDVQFNVLEPPRVPLVPTDPNRPLLSSAVLVGGLGAGIGFAWLLAMVRPAFYARSSVEELLGLPVLGVVSRLWTPRERFRRRAEVATFAVGCLCLVALFAGLQLTYRLDIELSGKLVELSKRLL